MINRIYKLLTSGAGMKTNCCHTDKYSVIEKKAVCTNESCANYLAQTELKNIFTLSGTSAAYRAG